MKRLIAVLMAAALLASLTACEDTPADDPDDDASVTTVSEDPEEETDEEEPVEEPVDESEDEPEETEEPVEEEEPVVEEEPNPEFVAELVTDAPMTADTLASYAPEDGGTVTYNEDGSVTANVSDISFDLPGITFGENALMYIKGTASADVRVSVCYGDSYFNSFDVPAGEFEKYILFDCGVEATEEGVPQGTAFAQVKSADGSVVDITISELAVYNGNLDDYKADVEWLANAPAEYGVAYDETKFTAIPVNQDSFGRAQAVNSELTVDDPALTWEDDGLTVNGATLVGFKLPSGVGLGKTVVVHIKGEAASNFRLWLLDSVEVTASRQINMSEYFNFESGEFDYIIELTAEYFDAEVADDTAMQLAFKAPTWDTTLDGLTVNEIGVYYGTLEDYLAGKESDPDYALEPVAEEEAADETSDETTDESVDDTTDESADGTAEDSVVTEEA